MNFVNRFPVILDVNDRFYFSVLVLVFLLNFEVFRVIPVTAAI